MKTCNQCQRNLPLDSFHIHNGFKDGRRKVCKECSCSNSRDYYAKNREQHLESCRKWQQNNREKMVAYQKSYVEKQKAISKRWTINNPAQREAHRKLNYAVFKGEIEKREKCQICGCVNRDIQGHHYDYTKPLEVIWVCTGCHGWIHRKRPTTQQMATT